MVSAFLAELHGAYVSACGCCILAAGAAPQDICPVLDCTGLKLTKLSGPQANLAALGAHVIKANSTLQGCLASKGAHTAATGGPSKMALLLVHARHLAWPEVDSPAGLAGS